MNKQISDNIYYSVPIEWSDGICNKKKTSCQLNILFVLNSKNYQEIVCLSKITLVKNPIAPEPLNIYGKPMFI